MDALFYTSFIEESKNACEARLCGFGRAKSAPKEETRRHIHSTLELFYFESGEGLVEVGKRVIPVKAHDLLIIDSSKLHLQYCKDKNNPPIYYGLEADKISLAGFNKNCVTFSGYFYHEFQTGDNPVYKKLLLIRRESEKKEYNYIAKIQLLFNEMFIDILRFVFCGWVKPVETGGGAIVNVQALERAKAYIDEKYGEEVTIEDLAKIALMSKSYFITQFKNFFQITPKQYLNLVRIQHACTLLTATDDSVVKIAWQVGFPNPVYFTETFTKINRLSPSAYRKKFGRKRE